MVPRLCSSNSQQQLALALRSLGGSMRMAPSRLNHYCLSSIVYFRGVFVDQGRTEVYNRLDMGLEYHMGGIIA